MSNAFKNFESTLKKMKIANLGPLQGWYGMYGRGQIMYHSR